MGYPAEDERFTPQWPRRPLDNLQVENHGEGEYSLYFPWNACERWGAKRTTATRTGRRWT